MSKKRLNYTALVVVATILFLAACKKENGKPNDNEIAEKDTVSRIIELQNIPNSSDIVTIKAFLDNELLASFPLQNGGFKLTLPQTVEGKYLQEGNWWSGDESITVSDPNAKTAYLGICGYSSAGLSPIGYVDLRGVGNDIYYYGYYIYADRDFTVIRNSEYANINFSFKKGWNICYSYYIGRTHYNTTEKPSKVELKWEYNEYSFPIVRFKKEKAYPNCVQMGIWIEEYGWTDISTVYHFGNSDGISPYYILFGFETYTVSVVYLDEYGDRHTAISDYPFEKNQAYTVICSDDGNGNLVFSVVKDGRKSLSFDRKHSLGAFNRQKSVNGMMKR